MSLAPVEVAPGVLVSTSALYATTSTMVRDGGSALLIDPAWQPDELEAIADLLDATGQRVVAGFASHAHHDHLLWHPRYGDGPRWASPRTAELARAERATLVAQLDGSPGELIELMGRVTGVEEASIEPDGFSEEIELVVHDAHAPGHTALWFPARGVLAVGDMLSDIELPLPFGPDDLPAYIAGLDRLAPYVARAEVLIPGHGTPTADPQVRLDADRRYLDDLAVHGASTDPRIGNEGMPQTHERLLALVRSSA